MVEHNTRVVMPDLGCLWGGARFLSSTVARHIIPAAIDFSLPGPLMTMRGIDRLFKPGRFLKSPDIDVILSRFLSLKTAAYLGIALLGFSFTGLDLDLTHIDGMRTITDSFKQLSVDLTSGTLSPRTLVGLLAVASKYAFK